MNPVQSSTRQTPEQPVPATPTTAPPQKKGGRIVGLDALRILLACWVVVSHFGNPPIFKDVAFIQNSALLRGLLGMMFDGVSAVIGFFVISGFCIHLPFWRGKPLNLGSYFIRREIRIVAPVLVAWVLGQFVFHNTHFLGILWSLVCEEIYYTIYPLLLPFRKKYGWKPIFGIALTGAAIILLTRTNDAHNLNFHALGFERTWILGYPVWLLGCVLAERVDVMDDRPAKPAVTWAFRFGVWGASMVCGYLRFHENISYHFTLPLLGVLMFFWIQNEIRHFRTKPPVKWLEAAGAASYTVYLTHFIGIPLVGLQREHLRDGMQPWLTGVLGVAILSTLFFLLVERPSHHLARYLGDKIDSRRKQKIAR